MRKEEKETPHEEETPIIYDLYVPAWAEQNGPAQPISTALSLDMGKHLCLQNFIQRCRTIKLRLPPEQQAEIPSSVIERLSLEWRPSETGVHAGQPKASLPQPLASITNIVYTLQPVR